jgi:hypothetical protein
VYIDQGDYEMNTKSLYRIGFLLVVALGLTLALSACTAVQAVQPATPTQSVRDSGFSRHQSPDAADDSAAIEQAMLDSMREKGAPTENARIEVQKVADGYARLHVYYDVVNQPGVWDQGFARLEDGAWKAWAFGSGIAQEHVEAAGIPRSVWPEGWLTDSPEDVACPESASDTRLLTNAAHGYCLLYPLAYKVEESNPSETSLVIGGLLNAEDPRVDIMVEEAKGRTAAAVADEVESGFPGLNIERSTITVGGVEAIVLDKLPGQDTNRRVFFEHNGLLYQLMFSWSGEETAGDSYARMEALYELIVNWFTFIPRSDAVVPGEDCLEAKAGEHPLTVEAHNFCLLVPAGYDVDASTENQVVLYVGTLLDVAHPKAFIEVQDAEGRTSEQIAHAMAAEAEAAMPGYDVEVSFGLSLGYEPAWVLENMPGQDISRQVIVVHDGQRYKLTFVPADPQAGEVYAQMESLYTLLINSFRFLR